MLPAGVRGGRRHRRQARTGPDGQDNATPPGDHARHQRPGELGHRENVGLQDLTSPRPIGLIEQHLVPDSGVVDQDIDMSHRVVALRNSKRQP
jgi:hypothetical protein